MKKIFYTIALTAFLLTACSHHSDIVVKTRLLLENGLRPEDGEIAIADGKIVFVGEKAMPYISSETCVVIYEDGLLMPGFVNCGVSAIATCKNQNPTEEEIINMQKQLAQNGVLMYEESNGRELCSLYRELDRNDKLIMPVLAEYELRHDEEFISELDNLIEKNIKEQSENFRFNAVKIVLDGQIEDHAALLLEPYCDKKDFLGERIWTVEEIGKILEKANDAELSVHAYCVGDGAAHDFIMAVQKHGKRLVRNSIVGLKLISNEDIRAMADLQITAVVNPTNWLKNDIYHKKTLPCLGEERAERIFPLNSLLQQGINVSVGSCFPNNFEMKYNKMLYNMIYRNNPYVMETLVGSEERIDITRALNIMSFGGFYQLNMEDGNGKINERMNANLVLSNLDLIECNRMDMLSSRLICTICNGKLIFKGK